MTDIRALSFYVQTIQDAYPHLSIHTLRMHNNGQNSDVLVVNDELIFRFPRYPEGVAALATEVAILAYIQRAMPIPVPVPLYTGSDMLTVGKAFMGYYMLSGEPLWRETLATIHGPGVVAAMAAQLGEFLAALHALPIEPLTNTVPVHDDVEGWRGMYDDIRQYLFSFMRADARRAVSQHFETFLTTPRLHQHPVTLRHGDFGTGNILFDAATHSISGIIDWSAAGRGDPAVDLAAVSGYGFPFFNHLCAAYEVDEAMLERARFYQGTYALQEALHGVKYNDRDAFQSGIAEYL